MKKIELRLDGATKVLGGPTEKTQRVIASILKLPDGEYFTADGVASRAKCSPDAIKCTAKRFPDEIRGYWTIVPGLGNAARTIVYGSKKSISKLRAQLEIE